MRAEILRKKLLADKNVYGTNVLFPEAATCELMGKAGCEFVWIDMEHGAIDYKDAYYQVIAAHAGGAAAIIRVPGNDPDMMKKVLDMGVDGVIFPLVRSAEEARKIIGSCLYPPKGFRGFNPYAASDYGAITEEDYCANAYSSTLRIIMLEHVDAYRELDDILSIEGLDGLMLGPSDFSGSLNRLLQRSDQEVTDMLLDTVHRARAAGKFVGIALGCNTPSERFLFWKEAGVRMFSFGQDVDFLYAAIRAKLQEINDKEDQV